MRGTIIKKERPAVPLIKESIEFVGFIWFGFLRVFAGKKVVRKDLSVFNSNQSVQSIQQIEEVEVTTELEDKEIAVASKWSFGPFVLCPVAVYAKIEGLKDFIAARWGVVIIWSLGYVAILTKILIQSINQIDIYEAISLGANALFRIRWWSGFCIFLYLIVILRECQVGRQEAWNRNNWKDFEHFKDSQHTWDVWGIAFLILYGIFFLFWMYVSTGL